MAFSPLYAGHEEISPCIPDPWDDLRPTACHGACIWNQSIEGSIPLSDSSIPRIVAASFITHPLYRGCY